LGLREFALGFPFWVWSGFDRELDDAVARAEALDADGVFAALQL
jgi:hypothetical protein